MRLCFLCGVEPARGVRHTPPWALWAPAALSWGHSVAGPPSPWWPGGVPSTRPCSWSSQPRTKGDPVTVCGIRPLGDGVTLGQKSWNWVVTWGHFLESRSAEWVRISGLELAGTSICFLTPRTAANCFENAFCLRILLWSVCLSGSSGTYKPHTQTPHRASLD